MTHLLLRTTYYILLTTYHLLLTTEYLPLTTYCLLLTIYHILLTTYYLLLTTTYYLLLTTYYLLLTTYYLLLTTYSLLLRLTSSREVWKLLGRRRCSSPACLSGWLSRQRMRHQTPVRTKRKTSRRVALFIETPLNSRELQERLSDC